MNERAQELREKLYRSRFEKFSQNLNTVKKLFLLAQGARWDDPRSVVLKMHFDNFSEALNYCCTFLGNKYKVIFDEVAHNAGTPENREEYDSKFIFEDDKQKLYKLLLDLQQAAVDNNLEDFESFCKYKKVD